MQVNADALIKLAENRGWSIPELANQLSINYSYLYRVLNGEKSGGAKLFIGMLFLCRQENLNIDDYIFLNRSLSANNKS